MQCAYLLNLKDNVCAYYFQKVHVNVSSAWAKYITDSNKIFWSQSRGNLVDSDSDSDSCIIATTPGDSDSDSDSASLVRRKIISCGEQPTVDLRRL